MRVRQLTIRHSRVVSDRQFGNYQAEAIMVVDLEGAEGTLPGACAAFQALAGIARHRVLCDVEALRERGEEMRLEA